MKVPLSFTADRDAASEGGAPASAVRTYCAYVVLRAAD